MAHIVGEKGLDHNKGIILDLIIAVLGSPTNDGSTCVLAREVLKGAQESGADVEEIFLADYKIEF